MSVRNRARRTVFHLIRSVGGLLLALALQPAAAQNGGEALHLDGSTTHYQLAQQLRYFADVEHKLDLQLAQRADKDGLFEPIHPNGEVNFGYSKAAYWLAFNLNSDAATPRDWLLEIAFPSLDHLEVYVPGESGYRRMDAGDLQPFDIRPILHRNFVFPLTLTSGQNETIYVRVVSQGSLTLPMSLWRTEAFAVREQSSYALLATYFGMLLALLLYNFLLYLSLRDRVFLAYVGCVASMALAQAAFNGFGNQFFWPHWPVWGNVALPSCMCATGFFGALFTRMFLNTRVTAPRLDKLICFMAFVFAFFAVSPIFLPYPVAGIATSLCGLAFSAIAVGAGWYCLRRGHAGARYFLMAWSLLLLGVAVLAMRNLSWLPTNWFTTNAMLIGSALEMLLLSFALADRIHLLRREKEEAQALALNTHRTMVEALRQSEQELEARVEERTRALAEANARLLESEQQLQHMVYHDPLTGLANRVLLYDRISHALAQSSRRNALIAVLMLDLDGFKPVNDRYGHDVGDQLLTAVANRLRATLRESDTVARFGGDEFVIALETVHHIQDAVAVAVKLLSEMARPFSLGDRELLLSASVGIAMYPDHGSDANTLIKRADEAMYRAKGAGRNAYRLAGA